MHYQVFASESVCSGHPDKLCDAISDAVLDACLAQDPSSRVACEALATENRIVLAGEITSNAQVSYDQLVRHVVRELGYTIPNYGFHADQLEVQVHIHQQSPEIAVGVDHDGAGDQGMMYGYACTETPELMPMPITLAHRLAQQLDQQREQGILPYLRPDGKTQVSVRYIDSRPIGVDSVVLAAPHDQGVSLVQLKQDLYNLVVSPILSAYGWTISDDHVIVNGTGVWHHGGPATDTGLTGRKIIVDGYGGMARVGGGAFSGKDPTKVDRSGAYGARYVAKNIVAAGLAERCEVQVAYCIGRREPTTYDVETFGTERIDHADLRAYAHFLLTMEPREIIRTLNLQRPIYQQTAAYGHFGKASLPWEQVAQHAQPRVAATA
ncbi:MAG: methionine adenosyltransferase [Chloroflexi bacterium]|nr:methionine adenosyltransferase [Chloroflexota bacterium]